MTTTATTIMVPLRTVSVPNEREHWAAKARRVRQERFAVGMMLNPHPAPALPCVVMLVRRTPGRPLDDDNLQGSLKATRDEVARWLGADDADRRIRWVYSQVRGRHYGIGITVQTDDLPEETLQ